MNTIIEKLSQMGRADDAAFLEAKLKPFLQRQFQFMKSSKYQGHIVSGSLRISAEIKEGKLIVEGLKDLFRKEKSIKSQWNLASNRLQRAMQKNRKTSSLWIERADAVTIYVLAAGLVFAGGVLVWEYSDCMTLDGYRKRCEMLFKPNAVEDPGTEFSDLMVFAMDYEKRLKKNYLVRCELQRLAMRKCLRDVYLKRETIGVRPIREQRRADYLNETTENPYDPDRNNTSQ